MTQAMTRFWGHSPVPGGETLGGTTKGPSPSDRKSRDQLCEPLSDAKIEISKMSLMLPSGFVNCNVGIE